MSRGPGRAQRSILACLDGRGWLTVRQLSSSCGIRIDNVNRALRRLQDDGRVERTDMDLCTFAPIEPATGGIGWLVRLSEVKSPTRDAFDLTYRVDPEDVAELLAEGVAQ